ncbi:hypothetical protein EWH70_09320 [Amycolatopsis suaedae]|uniref:Uncharacterized protein n=1 Tax=Amycolatopsis suaedae TaxID=2510978 RepID=A0A4Q7JCC1_9PSEU|nr:hypothetical protein [Amycolatopsis suaedae]RZQ64183.1 hypothetical protein EWH70_09320 [Amycolatopsis suaedae]
MAEQRRDEQEPAGPRLDPEQVRQFQQFQQFQDFLRYQEAQQQQGGGVVPYQQAQPPAAPPPPPPPERFQQAGPPELPPGSQPPKRRLPRWARWILGKLLGWLLLLIVLVIAGRLAWNYFFADQDTGPTGTQGGGGTYHTNKILSTSPFEAVRSVYDAIAQEDPRNKEPLVAQACGRFDEPIQQKFAQNMGFPDCRAAVIALHAQVTHATRYAESMPSFRSTPVPGDELKISSCRDNITGGIRNGPALGLFTVRKVEKGQWLIVDHAPEPPCAPPQQTGTTPTR